MTYLFVATTDEADDLDVAWGPYGPPAETPRRPWFSRSKSEPTATGPLYPMVAAEVLDSVKLATLEGILTGLSFDDVMLDLGAGYWRDGDDENGPWIEGVRPTLVNALGDVPDDRLAEVAKEWADTEEWTVDGGTAAYLEPLLMELRGLARAARQGDKRLFLWISF